jgi:hypothetical protein
MTALEPKLSELTGLEHPILNENLLEWAQARGYEGSTLGEKEIMEGLSTPRITAEAREALTLWSDIGVESMKKKIMREMNEFSRRGYCPVTHADIRMAVFMRDRLDFAVAELDALHKGLTTFEIPDLDDLESAIVKIGKNGG